MSPESPTWEIREGDVLDRLSEMPDESVHCVVTSPPYWGLRDYGTGMWVGGDSQHEHDTVKARGGRGGSGTNAKEMAQPDELAAPECSCGAVRVDSQIGLEATPEEYVAKMVDVFREVRRVLRDDGVCWLNLGDSYAGSWGAQSRSDEHDLTAFYGRSIAGHPKGQTKTGSLDRTSGLKPKDLVGIPWRVAFALQQPYYTGRIENEADRVWLAAMIDGEGCIFIHKRKAGQDNGQGYKRKKDGFGSGLEVANTSRAIVGRCMEITGKGSICSQERGKFGRKQTLYRWNLRSNECRGVLQEVYPHLVAKQQEARLAIGCPSSGPDAATAHESLKALHNGHDASIDFPAPGSMFERGWWLRSDVIWSKPSPMPESVRDRPTKSHEYVFLLTKNATYFYDADAIREEHAEVSLARARRNRSGGKYRDSDPSEHGRLKAGENYGPDGDPDKVCHPNGRNKRTVWTITTKPYPEAHFATFPPELPRICIKAGCPKGGTVLDPFSGAGTTGVEALALGRSFIGIELNPTYAKMSRDRIDNDCPLFNREAS